MSRKILIVIALLILVVLVPAFYWMHHSKNRIHDLPGILDSGRLSVLTDSSSIGFSVKGDSVSGFQYEIVKAFADSLGVELVISEKNDLKACMDGLGAGDYDIIANLVPVTTEWGKNASFSIPFFASREVLVQRINTDLSKQVTKHSQLANDTIYIPVNSPFKMRLIHLSNEIADPIHILELKNKSSEQMVRMVANGNIKYTICNEQFAQRLKKKFPNIDVSIPIGFAQQQAWVVHPNSPLLLEKLNEFLDDFIGSSAYWNIYRKYF
ncbi:MAG: transporter substrate-binding domain-containing protein [Paludibacter sp.]|nr:transporter substrate-binding domain-containing protein [Paludibacter sp.]